ncbi:MAG: hypothetical protein HY020_20565 [Burkholderiales bacterium]|nr:hypothetical protein [Burkholderiales bacterium]
MDPFTLKEVVGMVRHPARPWEAQLPRPLSKMRDADWQSLGRDYLDALKAALRPRDQEWIHADIRSALGRRRIKQQRSFGWLPITWHGAPPDPAPAGVRQPLGSFWVDREDEGKQLMPRLLVLLAGSVVTEHQLQMGSDMGLRIVFHVHAGRVSAHGLTMSGLSTDRALKVVPEPWPRKARIYSLVEQVRDKVGKALDCGRSVWVGNLEKVQEGAMPTTSTSNERLIATGFALRWRRTRAQAVAQARARPGTKAGHLAKTPPRWAAPTRARIYDFRVELDLDRATGDLSVVQVHRDFYVNSGAAPPAVPVDRPRRLRAFVQDAASKGSPGTLSERRCTLSDGDLDKFRDDIEAELPLDKALRFSDVGSGALFEMRGATREGNLLGGTTVARNKAGVVKARPPELSPAAQGSAPGQGVSLGEPALRSDEQASVDAHLRSAELFGRMLAYGINPHAYVRFAKLPLVQRARPEMRWAPDGELPNAEVRPFLGDAEADEASKSPLPKARDPLQLLVKYGSADPVHRRKLPFVKSAQGHGRGDGRLKSQYLSVACDPRWAWHEFGHVLAFASTGELEFPFAHSPGDGLAAIAADPISGLATADDPDAEIRHVTFPWIEVPGRSHGRSATRGYGWCGCRNLTRLDFTASLERYHHNYFGEQILSSSLFRLYRSLGGDTRGADGTATEDEAMRLSASDYCIYLIMRGVSLLGPDSVAPARTPDQFVSALIEADLGTGDWQVTATWPFNRDERYMSRRGGRVHKVIRWAFEQQGLYATDDPTTTSEEVGRPPAVDVFIDDRAGRGGGYDPLALRHGIDDPEPWHASDDGLRRQGGKLIVRVGNRGHRTARQTRLRLWWAPSPPDATVHDAVAWRELPAVATPHNILGGAAATYKLAAPVADTARVWVLVSADAPADPSNLADKVPPPSSWPELLELVAHDNNLALAKL